MTIATTRFSLARVTIELTTAYRSSAFRERAGADMAFITDCNGLPTLPGTSIAGVLRHAWADIAGVDLNTWFGTAADSDGQPSLVEVSGGQVHNKSDQPVPFLSEAADLEDDPVLALLLQGNFRDHVRLSAWGVADVRGKYDELVVPAGARFTFELRVNARTDQDAGNREHLQVMDTLLALLNSPMTRLGGATRRGLGAFTVRQALRRDFDLKQPADLQAWSQLPVDLAEPLPKGVLTAARIDVLNDPALLTATLCLKPDDFWSFGGGQAMPDYAAHRVKGAPTDKKSDAPSTSQSVPVHEPMIQWKKGSTASVVGGADATPHHYIPGSSVKGALRHRIEFHARRRLGIWLGNEAEHTDRLVEYKRGPGGTFAKAALALGGAIKSSGDGPASFAGAFGVDDQHRGVGEAPLKTLMHVAIDRFTQGPMDGFLFSETAFYGGPDLELTLFVNTRQLRRNASELVGEAGADALVGIAAGALADALGDLREGRLALGARSARGLGYVTGTVQWTDDGAWISAPNQNQHPEEAR
jgi:CRISPR/Cas system CSM-associated protein Csm3 (group 7 of RAMP superfamily)